MPGHDKNQKLIFNTATVRSTVQSSQTVLAIYLYPCHSDRREESALPREKRYYVYIMASKGRVLYIGVTGFLMPRVLQHKAGESDFTKRYNINRLVYYESFQYVNNALARETEIKKWRREKKIALIEAANPTWEDLAAEWGKPFELGTADSSLRSE